MARVMKEGETPDEVIQSIREARAKDKYCGGKIVNWEIIDGTQLDDDEPDPVSQPPVKEEQKYEINWPLFIFLLVCLYLSRIFAALVK